MSEEEKVVRLLVSVRELESSFKKLAESAKEKSADVHSFAKVLREIENLPTIDPESLRPVAHWEESVCFDDTFWVCSNCKFPSEAIAAPRLYHYCPNCGAKMEDKNGKSCIDEHQA